MRKKISLNKLLLREKNICCYTKLLIILYQLDYFNDHYIPNKKLENILKSDFKKRNIIYTLNKIKDDEIITIFYRGKKRYFSFNNLYENEPDNNEIPDLNYDWLNENDGDDKNE